MIHDGDVSPNCDTLEKGWVAHPEGRIMPREAGGSEGSSTLQRPVPHAERAPLQCPARPIHCPQRFRTLDYVSVPPINPLLILKRDPGHSLDSAQRSQTWCHPRRWTLLGAVREWRLKASSASRNRILRPQSAPETREETW